MLLTVCSSVDESKSMDLASLELKLRAFSSWYASPPETRWQIACKPICAVRSVRRLAALESSTTVDKSTIASCRLLLEVIRYHVCDYAKIWNVVPIADHDWSKVDVVVKLRWAVDLHRTDYTGGVLRAVVGVIHRTAVLVGAKSVRITLPWRDWTLTNTRCTILPLRTELQRAMPMHRGPFLR